MEVLGYFWVSCRCIILLLWWLCFRYLYYLLWVGLGFYLVLGFKGCRWCRWGCCSRMSMLCISSFMCWRRSIDWRRRWGGSWRRMWGGWRGGCWECWRSLRRSLVEVWWCVGERSVFGLGVGLISLDIRCLVIGLFFVVGLGVYSFLVKYSVCYIFLWFIDSFVSRRYFVVYCWVSLVFLFVFRLLVV